MISSVQRSPCRPRGLRRLRSRDRPAPIAAARVTLLLLATLVTAGCTIATPDPTPRATAPPAWQGSLPHGGDVTSAIDWWAKVGDPVLVDLIAAAQADNPGLDLTVARIDQARAAARVAGASLLPRVDANTTLTRSKSPMPPTPVVMTMVTGTLDTVWELDLFGAHRRTREAAVARAEGMRLQWHEARVSLAAEVAQAYLDLRTCEALLQVYREDLESLDQSRSLTGRKVDAGFGAPADLELVTASAADGAGRVRGQEGQCRLARVTLGWLTGLASDDLDRRLATGTARLPEPASLIIDEVPARVLAQRPDLAALQKEIEAASLDVGVARAARYPKLSLTGSIGYSRANAFGQTFKGPQWSIGPGLVAPLFDGGRNAALVDQAGARFAETMTSWQQRARLAVREVESALIRIDSAQARLAEAERAVPAYQRYLRAAESRYQTGAGSLFEQEDARRSTLQAAGNLLQLKAERFAAWLALYKAVGGGWQDDPLTGVTGVTAVTAVTAVTGSTGESASSSAVAPVQRSAQSRRSSPAKRSAPAQRGAPVPTSTSPGGAAATSPR